jgi:hypothetical protein
MKWILFLVPHFWIHEGGHQLAALFCGEKLTFFYQEGNLWGVPVPRYCWYMPDGLSDWQEAMIYRAGFLWEGLAGLPLLILWPAWGFVYLAGFAAHRCLYVSYGGNPKEVGK